MNKAIGLALLVAGIILLIYGISTADSVGSSFSRFFTGKPTDKAVWLISGGAAAIAAGAWLAVLGGRRT